MLSVLLDIGKRVVRVAQTEQLTFLAAGVAYYSFVSLIPLSLLALAAATVVGEDIIVEQIADAATGLLTPSAQALLTETVTDDAGRGGATVVGFVGLLWAGSRLFRGLDRAFSAVYSTEATKTIVGQFRDSVIVVVAIVLGLLAVVGIETILTAAAPPFLWQVGPLFLFLTLLAAFLPMYIVFPDTGVDIYEALPGVAFAALGWTILTRGFTLYAGVAGTYAIYGALGAVFLVLTWLYIGALLILAGGALNLVLADRDTDRQLQSPGERQVSTGAMTDDATGRDEEPADRTDSNGHEQGQRQRTSARTRDRADDPEVLREEIERLRDDLESFETDIDSRTVERESLESDLKRYIRRKRWRGHAHGWGPYLVLLYGTIMTLGAFYLIASSWAAVAAMFVIWTSTLGVYILMVLFGTGISVLGVPGRLRDRVSEFRS